jgi:hypothetical protein
MGANAQTAVPSFTAGQVLTAAQQTQINTGIPVFATTVTRDAAFDGAGEKVLAQGQYAFIEATNTTQYYNGSAWVTAGGAMVWLGGAAPSAAATVTVDNVFSSAYTHYLITFSFTGGTNEELRLQFRYGTTTQAAAYFSGFNTASFNGTTGALSVNNGTYISLCGDADRSTGQLFVSGVGVSGQAMITGQGFGKNNGEASSGGGYVNSTQTYTGFIFTNSSAGNIFTGRVNVYGLANA